MSISYNDDTADIFWPGYVDAIANLALNLLFVSAILSMVYLGHVVTVQGKGTAVAQGTSGKELPAEAASLELKGSVQEQEGPELNQPHAHAVIKGSGEIEVETVLRKTLDHERRQFREELKVQAQRLARAELSLKQYQDSRQEAQGKTVSAGAPVLAKAATAASSPVAPEVKLTPTVLASAGAASEPGLAAKTVAPSASAASGPALAAEPKPPGVRPVASASVVAVVFDPSSTVLTAEETREMLRRLANLGVIEGNTWRITTQRLSEGSSNDRGPVLAQAVRDALIAHGANPQSVSMQVTDAGGKPFNANRVIVQRMAR
jgi:hypothetical protein